MFAALGLVCGLSTEMSNTVNGCGLVFTQIPYATEEECEYVVVTSFIQNFEIPEGAYWADLQCVPLSVGT